MKKRAKKRTRSTQTANRGRGGRSAGGEQRGRNPAEKKEDGSRPDRLTPGRRRAVYVAVLLSLSIFTFLCIFAPGSVGIVGRAVHTWVTWLLGLGRYAVPFLLLSAALLALPGQGLRKGLVVSGSAMMAVSILAMLSMSLPPDRMFLGSELADGGGGGILGGVLAWPLVKLFGNVGAFVFLWAALAAGLVIAFEEQLRTLFGRLREGGVAVLSGRTAAGAAVSEKEAQIEPPAAEGGVASEAPAKIYPFSPKPTESARDAAEGRPAMKMTTGGKSGYRLPPQSILNRAKDKAFSKKSNEERKAAIEHTLQSMGVDAKVVKFSKGPTVSLFEVEVGTGEKVRRVTELEQDIAYALGSPDIRIYSPIPGRQAIGIEVPNHIRDTVLLGDVIDKLDPPAPHNLLTMAVGKDMSGEPVILDLAQLPHLLLAGSTGAGKSCCINCLVCCLLMRARPEQVKFIMIDPKFVEFTFYDGLPHLLTDVINEPEPAAKALQWAVREMDRRYQELQKQKVVHIDDYNAIAEKDENLEIMPKIVIVIDELGDLMIVARREVETSINRLTAKARAVGIHMIIATQRPSVDVITGVIKNNITARIAFQVASNADSRTILGTKGAEKLLGKGDMLLDPGNIPQPERVQGALVRRKEIDLLTGYIREQKVESSATIDLQEEVAGDAGEIAGGDPLLDEAAQFVVFAGEASASMLQTHLRIGYARARRIIHELEDLGIVGPHEGSKSRRVLITREEFEGWRTRTGG